MLRTWFNISCLTQSGTGSPLVGKACQCVSTAGTRVKMKFWGHHFTTQKVYAQWVVLFKSTGTLGAGLAILNISDWSSIPNPNLFLFFCSLWFDTWSYTWKHTTDGLMTSQSIYALQRFVWRLQVFRLWWKHRQQQAEGTFQFLE